MAEFVGLVRQAMEQTFGDDRRRIDHALAVAGWAETLLRYIDADPVITLSAAYLHDIGIHAAERKHGSSAGRYQEIEGPPIAREILVRLGADPHLVETVCELVGNHHTPEGVDSPEFRILWDADALVNLEEVAPHKNEQEMARVVQRSFVTEAGYRLGMEKYLSPGSLAPHLKDG
ncbi:metal dependent phosphohydrolase [Geothermobacter ehrlichii]|uniref:Metal dependent phosphohydrolase n=1 Tax=Geothermobacter ehrlichii TaxID=213224 RepID=A0A5D3WKW7_9BACT|nr:HD domain-containing protein [Geothermobacter ehrlichii]TYO99667.1 metal dependent phosphohydrolase [Geothermobacter ehrlichii]